MLINYPETALGTAKRNAASCVLVIFLVLMVLACGGSETNEPPATSNEPDTATVVPDTSIPPADTQTTMPDTTVSAPEIAAPSTPLTDALHGGDSVRWDLKQAIYVGADGAELDITDACAVDDYYLFRSDSTYDKHVGILCRPTEAPVTNGSWSVDETTQTILFSEFGPDMPFAIQSLVVDQLWLVLDLSTVPTLGQQGLVRTRFERSE